MANVNCYPSNVVKQDQPVNSQYIQKILDENVGLIHAIIDKQQQNQEAEDLLKSLHKNLIYLATIADQTTSAGNPANTAPAQHQYNYPQATINHPPNFPGNIPSQPMQSMPYVTQSSMVAAQTASIETVEKKSHSGEDSYKEMNLKPEPVSSINVDIDRDMDKCHPVRDPSHHVVPATHKNVDIDKDCPISQVPDVSKESSAPQNVPSSNPEYIQKFEENLSTTTAHMQNANIKTDMPPPSQPIGIHQDKASAMQYPGGSQRIVYPGVPPNYNQYNPHFDQQNSKFYPQPVYQQSPYNYQGMYHPYQPVAPPAAPSHYSHNQHMMNTTCPSMYQQYPPYYQQPGLEQMPKESTAAALPSQMQQHPGNPIGQPMYPPNTSVPQSMYPSQQQQHPMPPQAAMHPPPPNTLSQSSIKPPQNADSSSLPQSNANITD